MKASTRVIINTGAQYIRSILSVVITLYTSRVILENLGVNDFGIYSLVAGVVTMLSFVQNNLARTTQRFLNFYHGRKDSQMIRAVFNNSVITQLGISIFLCILLFGLTDVVFTYLLKIDPIRENMAMHTYWIMLISLFFNLMSAPFYAVLIAHENLVYVSVIQVIEAVLKIPIAVSLFFITSDKLIWYTWLICASLFLNFAAYAIYDILHYNECNKISISSFRWNLTKEMFSFMGWSMYGTFCVVGRTQGVAILINRFFTTAVNAAYGICNQVVGQLSFLSVALTTAINPQMVKAEGEGNREKLFRLAEISAKYSFLLISIILVPVYFYMDYLLEVWLKDIPPFTATCCRWMIIISLIDWTTQSLNTVNIAVGNVKMFNIVVNSILLLTVPVGFICLKFFPAVECIMIVYCVFTLLLAIGRLVFLHYSVKLNIIRYIYSVIFSITPIFFVNSSVCYILSNFLPGMGIIIVGICSLAITVIGCLCIGLKEDERMILIPLFQKFRIR